MGFLEAKYMKSSDHAQLSPHDTAQLHIQELLEIIADVKEGVGPEPTRAMDAQASVAATKAAAGDANSVAPAVRPISDLLLEYPSELLKLRSSASKLKGLSVPKAAVVQLDSSLVTLSSWRNNQL